MLQIKQAVITQCFSGTEISSRIIFRLEILHYIILLEDIGKYYVNRPVHYIFISILSILLILSYFKIMLTVFNHWRAYNRFPWWNNYLRWQMNIIVFHLSLHNGLFYKEIPFCVNQSNVLLCEIISNVHCSVGKFGQ